MIKIFGDLHFTSNKEINEKILNKLKKFIHKGDILIFLGDIVDNFEDFFVIEDFYKFILNYKTYILKGNHDYSSNLYVGDILNNFVEDVVFISDYYFFDYEDTRFHFVPFYRYKSKIQFSIDESKYNVLCSHLDNPEIFSNYFNLIINGHLHNFFINENVYNVGAFRQCKINETKDKYYIEYKDSKNYKLIKYDTPIFVVSENEKIDNKNNEDIYVIKRELKEIKGNVDIEGDYKNVYDLFYKFSENKEYADIFVKYLHNNDVKTIFNTSVKLKKIKIKNFKLFSDLEYDFNYDSGIIGIIGINNDEVDGSSNESGKSSFLQAIKYAFDGEGNVLKFGEEEGFVVLNFVVGDDDIVIYRKFTNKKKELRIVINDEVFYDNETNTDKQELFYKKYPFLDILRYVFIENDGSAEYFFNSTSQKRLDILKNIFSFLNVDNIFDKIKEDKQSYEKQIEKYEILKEREKVERNLVANKMRELLKVIDKNFKYNKELYNKCVQYVSFNFNFSRDYSFVDEDDIDNSYKYYSVCNKYGKEYVDKLISKYRNYDYNSLKRKIEEIDSIRSDLKTKYEYYNNMLKHFIEIKETGKCNFCGSIFSDKEYIIKNINIYETMLNEIIEKAKAYKEENARLLEEEKEYLLFKSFNFSSNDFTLYSEKECEEYKNYKIYKSLFSNFNMIKEECEKYIEECNTYNRFIELKEKIREMQKNKVLIDKNVIEYYNKLNEILSMKQKFSTYITNYYLNRFSDIFNLMLNYLFERGVEIRFTDKSVIFYDKKQKAEIKFSDFSGGAKTKIKVAFMLTINKLVSSFKFLFIDEYIDNGVDIYNIKKIVDLIENLYDDTTVYIISHRTFLNNNIVFERKNNETKLKGL